MEKWYLLDSGYNAPEFNMALDEALLDYAYNINTPILRFYKWQPPTLSIGYFQKASSSVNFEELRKKGFAFIRRPTGGRAVLHNKEITYSIALPVSHKFLSLNLIDSYEVLCIPIVNALNNLGIEAYLSNDNDSEIDSPSCFAAPTFKDIKVNGRKLIGSAQTRNKRGLMQHGSILLDVDIYELFSVLNVKEDNMRLAEKGSQKITSLRNEGFNGSEQILKDEIVKAYKELLDIEFILLKDLSLIGNLNEYLLKYKSKEWNFRI